MKKYGLIGYPLGHSFSKTYFGNKFNEEGIKDCCYDNYPIKDISELYPLIESTKELSGLNVTIPYKQQLFDILNEIDPVAAEVGAVNTIKIYRSKESNNLRLVGYNSDVYGFEKPLLPHLKGRDNLKALILGTGGASKAVSWVLKNNDISFAYVSRTPKGKGDFSYDQINKSILEEYHLIINTSPIGMYPNVDKAPEIDYSAITSKHILYDLVYNPEKTLFLRTAEEKSATVITGLPMLFLQAERSWEIWNS